MDSRPLVAGDGQARRANGTVAHRVAAALHRHGVREVFGQSLPTMVHLACAEIGIRQIAYRAENAGGYMADGFARVSGRVPVVTAQNGPAATLLVAPLAEALKASVPIVALVQDVDRQSADRNAFQEFDHVALFASCSKWVRSLNVPARTDDYIDMAFREAASGRPGPAVLLLPADVLLEPLPLDGGRRADLGRYPLDRPMADPERIEKAVRLLATAERPLVIAGGGVHLAQAAPELAALQERACLPVATTVMGKGAVDEGHPLSVGVVGYFMGSKGATRYLRPLIEEADTVLLVGTRTNQNGTDSWSLYPPAARYIHIDIDGREAGRTYEAVRLIGDARSTLAGLTAALERQDLARRRTARTALEAQIAQGRAQHRQEVEALAGSPARPIRPERIMRELDRLLTPDSIVVADASYSSIWIANCLTSRRPGMRFLSPRGLAGIGWGFPMALGAKVACPERPVVCITGDGGFGHCWSELETARRMGLAVALVVLNNQSLGYQKHGEDAKFGAHTDACDLTAVDHAAIARACGCEGQRIEDPESLAAALAEALGSDKTTLLDVVIDPDAHPPITSFERAVRPTV